MSSRFASPLQPRPRSLRQRLRWRRPAAQIPTPPSQGAALMVELIISSVLVLTSFMMAASLSSTAANGLGQTSKFTNRDAAVNADIGELRSLAARYSFCDGKGTLAPSGPSCLKQGNPYSDYKSEDYFSPYNPDPSTESSEQVAFRLACDNTSADVLTANLLKAMLSASATSSQLGAASVSRTIVNDDIAAHRLRVVYTGTKVDRTVLITPTVAAWCP